MARLLTIEPGQSLALLLLVGVTGWGALHLGTCPPTALCHAAGHGRVGYQLVMWAAMIAVMLPALLPAWRATLRHGDWATGPALAAGYVLVWLSAAAAASVVPVPREIILLSAGLYQLLPWKAKAVQALRRAMAADCPRSLAAAWRAGLGAGWHCVRSNLAVMAGLAAIGMSPAIMAAGYAAMMAERFLPETLARRGVAILLVAAAIATHPAHA